MNAFILGVLGVALVLACGALAFALLHLRVTHEQLARAGRETDELVEAQRDLSVAVRDGVDAVSRRLVAAARKLVPEAQTAAVLECNVAGRLVTVFAEGARLDAYRGVELEREREPTLVAATLRDGRARLLGAGAEGLHPSDASAIAVAIPLDGERAILYVGSSRQEEWSQSELDALQHLCTLSGPAYTLAQDREALQSLAMVDPMSGCLTNAAFVSRLNEEIARVRHAPSGRISVMFIDADGFKEWNDTYGHNSGDRLIERLGRAYRAAVLSPLDLVGRKGGDEFCIALLNCDKTDALSRANELRHAIASEDRSDLMPPGVERVLEVTGSIGVATYPHDATTAEGLIAGADRAMYAAKAAGRNRVAYLSSRGEIAIVSEADAQQLLRERRRGVPSAVGRRLSVVRVAGDD